MVFAESAKRSVRRWLVRGALAALVLPAGCEQKSTEKPGAEAVKELGPVAAPPGLIAELVIAHPNTVWSRSRDMIGGSMKFLPASYPMLVGTMLGLPPSAADQIDLDVPTVGAAISDGTKETPVLAVHVKDGAQLTKILSGSPDARYTAKPDAPSGVTLLEPKAGQTSLNASIGVSGNYLLIGYAPDGLLKVGPYAARTLSKKPVPKDDVLVTSNQDALAGPLRTRLSMWWGDVRRSLEKADQEQRERHGGSAPSFGDPKAALQKADGTFQGIFALMTDLSEGKVSMNIDDSGLHIAARLTPRSPDGTAAREFAAMKTGEARGLLDLPASASVGLLMIDSAQIRERSAADQGEALEKVLAGKLSGDDRKKLQAVLDSWSKGRGDWMLLGGSIIQNERTLFARSSIADIDALDRGIRSTFDLLKMPALSEPIQHWLGEIKFGAVTPLEGARGALVKAERQVPIVQIDPETKRPVRKPKDEKEEKKDDKKKDDKSDKKVDKKDDKKKKDDKGTETRAEAFELSWSLDKEIATYAMAKDARAAMREIGGDATLKAEGEVKAMVDSLGSEASFALLVLPLRLVAGMMPKGSTTHPPAAPVLISFGRSNPDGWFRVDAAAAAVRELAKIRPMD